nr:hypothetical protein Iba_chr14fCG2540 [Ipomoea batatas]
MPRLDSVLPVLEHDLDIRPEVCSHNRGESLENLPNRSCLVKRPVDLSGRPSRGRPRDFHKRVAIVENRGRGEHSRAVTKTEYDWPKWMSRLVNVVCSVWDPSTSISFIVCPSILKLIDVASPTFDILNLYVLPARKDEVIKPNS